MNFEGGGEQVVKVDFVRLVDARNGDGAAVALLAGAGCRALFLVFAVSLNGVTSPGSDVDHLGHLPVFESCVVCHEGCSPLVRVVNHVLVRAILEVFLLTGIEEQV